MKDTNPNDSLRKFTRERFQEEVARELGIDLNTAQVPRRELKNHENDLRQDASEDQGPS